MSWQSWVDHTLVGSEMIDKAAIFSLTDEAELAASEGFEVYPEEVEYLLRGFEDSIPLYAGGLYIAGENLDVTKINDQSIYAQNGEGGVCVVKSSGSIIIAHYPETVEPENAATFTVAWSYCPLPREYNPDTDQEFKSQKLLVII